MSGCPCNVSEHALSSGIQSGVLDDFHLDTGFSLRHAALCDYIFLDTNSLEALQRFSTALIEPSRMYVYKNSVLTLRVTRIIHVRGQISQLKESQVASRKEERA